MPVLDVGTGNLSFEFESDANVIGNMLLKLTDDGGTENGGDEDNNFNFYLESTPVLANFSYEANGLTVVFTNTSQYVGEGILTYNWNFGDNNTSTEQSPTYMFANADTFTVSLTSSDGADDHTYSIDIIVAETGPEVGDIPDQTVESGQSFDTFDLDLSLIHI